MSRKTIGISIAVIVLLALGVWLGTTLSSAPKDSQYSAVYLSSGDVYFGKLSWFPKPHLVNAWHLDRTVDRNNNPQTSLVPLSSAPWGPSDDLYLNQSQIVFWSRLRADSQVVKAMDGSESAQPQLATSTP